MGKRKKFNPNRQAHQLADIINRKAKINEDMNTARITTEITPQIYAVLALALHREFGFGDQRIKRAFQCSQEIWLSGMKPEEILNLCEEETGIRLEGE